MTDILFGRDSYPFGGVVRKGHWEESAFYSLLVGHHLLGSRQRFLQKQGVAILETSLPVPNAGREASAQKSARTSELVFLLQVSRPGLWSTTALFYLMPLGHADFLHSWTLWLGLFYVLFPLGFLLYGVNDIVDAEADRLNPRKGTFLFGSLGRAEQLAALRWKIAAVQIPFLILFFFVIGPRIFAWFGVLLIAVGIYNAPRFGWKGRPPFDVLIQASYLLVFVLSSWLNGVSQLPWQTFLFGALFAMHAHIFGEVMDMEPDQLSGRRTTATLLGAVSSKLLMAGILCVETALVYVSFGDVVITCFLGLGAVWFLVDATALWKNKAYSPGEMRLFMWGWNVAALAGMVWNWTRGSLLYARHFAGWGY